MTPNVCISIRSATKPSDESSLLMFALRLRQKETPESERDEDDDDEDDDDDGGHSLQVSWMK